MCESQDRAQSPGGVGDYFVLEAESACWYVSTAMARTIDAALSARRQREWVTFVDLVGARVRLRTRRVESLTQCSEEQRAARRRVLRQLNEEGSWE